jgi:exonuclease III
MRLLAWNIRQGGGTRLAGIMTAIARHDADVLVLSEYRGGDSAERLRAALKACGYRYLSRLVPPAGRTGVLIAARRRFVERGPICSGVEEPWRLLDVDLGIVRLTGVYMPNLFKKVPYWQSLIDAFAARASADALAIGDFNTCRAHVDEPGALDATAHFMDAMDAIGFRDLWRHRYPDGREFSWYSHRGNGFRIDHAFLSASLAARAGAVRYSHEERLCGLSDHSILLLDLARAIRRADRGSSRKVAVPPPPAVRSTAAADTLTRPRPQPPGR